MLRFSPSPETTLDVFVQSGAPIRQNEFPTFSTFVNIKANHRTKEPRRGLMLKQALKLSVSVTLAAIWLLDTAVQEG